jgi:hypothetical protein
VYLENLSTTSEAELLVVDSDGKVSKKNESTLVIDTSDFLDNAANNRVVTATGAADGSPAIIGESNLTFDGTTLTLAGLINMTSTIGIELATSATTQDVFDVTANSLTTGDAIKIVANAMTTGRFIDLAQADAGTASATCTGLMQTAYTKSGVIGDGNTRDVTGHNILLVDAATNHANATSTLTGMQIQSSFVNNAGTTTAEGINIIATGADTNIGLTTKVTDGGTDVKCMSSADTGDYFSISTTTHGATTLTTVDDDATAADLTLDPDGKVVITPADISGDVFHLDADADTDNVVNIDAGVLDIDVTATATIDVATSLTITGKTRISNRILSVTAGSSAGEFDGDVVYTGTTTGMTTGALYVYANTGGWVLANAGVIGTTKGLLAIALGDESDVDGMLLRGMVTTTTVTGTQDEGAELYMRNADGVITATAPSGSGQFVRIVGYCMENSNNRIYFNPDNTYIEIA